MSLVLVYLSSLTANVFAAALMMWVGAVVPVLFNFAGWEGKSWKLFVINGGYWLVYLLGVATILSILTK
jgi:hypothetical protein